MRRGIAAVLSLLTVVLVSGCGLFDTRPVRPGTGPVVTCLTPNTVDAVVSNVLDQYAVLAGITCYTAMLDTSFAFHPDPSDSLDALPDTVFAHWTRDVEVRDASTMAANVTFRIVAFDSLYAPTVISPDQRTQTRFYAYHLIVHASQVAPDTLFQGRADITFFQGSDAQWHVTQWIDRRDASGLRTWGYLRRVYRVGF